MPARSRRCRRSQAASEALVDARIGLDDEDLVAPDGATVPGLGSLLLMGGAAIDATKLARALGKRLATVVPAECEIAAADAHIRLAMRGPERWSEQDLRWMLEDGEREAQLCFAAWKVLDGFQDDIAHELTEPWPAISPGPMPEAFARIVDDEVVGGYGVPNDPLVQLKPMRLRDLV